MTLYYSALTGGFYDDAIHNNIPAGAVEITADDHVALLAGQSAGKRIAADAYGCPVLCEPPLPSVADLRARRQAEINAHAAGLLATLSAAYPDSEVQSWGQQTREAEALALNPSAPAPLLTTIASARGLLLAELAARVREKVQAYAVASGQIIGQRQALEDKLLAIDLASPDAEAQINAVRWENA